MQLINLTRSHIKKQRGCSQHAVHILIYILGMGERRHSRFSAQINYGSTSQQINYPKRGRGQVNVMLLPDGNLMLHIVTQ